MDYKSIVQHHMKQLSNQVGHDITTYNYNYVSGEDELMNAYAQMRNDLGYPLAMDSKYRRAIVYNKQGIEKQIAEMIEENIMDNIGELESEIANNVANDIINQLNGLTQTASGTIVLGGSSSGSGTVGKFASLLAKGLVKGVGKIVDDIIDG